jgi:hypothetical protein
MTYGAALGWKTFSKNGIWRIYIVSTGNGGSRQPVLFQLSRECGLSPQAGQLLRPSVFSLACWVWGHFIHSCWEDLMSYCVGSPAQAFGECNGQPHSLLLNTEHLPLKRSLIMFHIQRISLVRRSSAVSGFLKDSGLMEPFCVCFCFVWSVISVHPAWLISQLITSQHSGFHPNTLKLLVISHKKRIRGSKVSFPLK